MEKRGPIAPKDPTAKRPGIRVMSNKTIFASPQEDGRGICFIYSDNGRLKAAAKLVSGLEDEEILKMMDTAEGLRKLIHSIGVSVRSHDDREDVNFAFQMYGKTDPYVSGTTINMNIPSDGMEYVCNMSDIEWSDDDNVPGQIRFEFVRPEIYADVTVTFYLNDGYDAPDLTTDEPIDFESDTYKKIIGKSLLNKGNNYRIKKALSKARTGEDVTVAFIGGSITQGAGAVPINTKCYAYNIFEGICERAGRGTDENIHYVKAGVGGTPSELGILRYETDVLNDGQVIPDVVVVEFAVNDEGDETKGVCYDSLVRKIYNGPGKPAVILLYAVFANDWNLEERLGPVGYAYNLPMVSTRQSVVEQFYLPRDKGGVLSKNQFFYDLFHPANAGHKIMADGVLNLIDIMDADDADEDFDITDIKAPIGSYFENISLLDRAHNEVGAVVNVGGFKSVETELQCVERNLDLTVSPEFKDNWMYQPGNGLDSLMLDVECKALIVNFLDSASIEVGIAEAYVDGELRMTMDPHEIGWLHCDPRILYQSDVSAKHRVEIKIKEGYENCKFTVLGFGVVK